MAIRGSKPFPPAWLAIGRTTRGTQVALASFRSKAEAENFLKTSEGYPDVPFRYVQEDSPDLRVRVDDIRVSQPFHLTVRENWLVRCKKWTKALMNRGKEASVVTWDDSGGDDLLGPRLGGDAPMPTESAWPRCRTCEEALSFVGSLDFRGTSVRPLTPGDTLTFYYCFGCHKDESVSLTWLREGQAVVAKSSKGGQPSFRPRFGECWRVIDYPWDWSDTNPLSDKSTHDESIVGFNPGTCVTVYGTKAGGHVFWIKGKKVPKCSCQREMEYVGQFASHDDVQFRDAGLAYIFVCGLKKCGETKVVVQSF